MRLLRFARILWALRKMIFRSPIDWHNLGAAWHQSDPSWMTKFYSMAEMTDEEFEEWMEAIK